MTTPTLTTAAAALGAKGGKSKSKRKQAAAGATANDRRKQRGRPRKTQGDEKMSPTKKQLIESGETLTVDYGSMTACASDTEEYGEPDRFIITYHQGRMPASSGDGFKTIDELIAKMQSIAPLNKWRVAVED